MSRGGPGIKRRFHFKSPPLKDLAIQRFKEWLPANQGFYVCFRLWLKENGYGDSALNLYGAATRMAIGYLRKPYWMIDPEADIERMREHLAHSYRTLGTQADYGKGLKKLAEYLRLRNQRPSKPKEISWQYAIGSLSPELQSHVRAYIQHRQRNWKPDLFFERCRDTLYPLARPLRWMAEHANVHAARDLAPQVWYKYLDQRLKAGMKPATVNGELYALQDFIRFLLHSERAVCERFLLIESLKIGFRMPRDVPLEGLRKLQAAIQAKTHTPHPGRRRIGLLDLAWFLLMIHCGLRTCEVRNLKLGDIQWEAKRLRIEQSKGLKDRHIYLDEAVLAALRSYLAVRGQADALPQNVFIYRHALLSRTYCFERLQTYGRTCGVKASPHQLRHSCATLLLNAGAPVLSVQMILGHKQVDTTLGYARLYDGTIAADYFSAMNKVERQLALPEDSAKETPRIGELIALTDALRNGALNPTQTELVRALREGLGLLEEQVVEDDKVQEEVAV
jgi:site-specific recombinase XerD